MIEFDHLSYSYPAEAPLPVLHDISLTIDDGEFIVVIGPSGAGKSTLLRCINGLVPHFYGGTLGGSIRVAGRDPVTLQPRQMSRIVGFVFQDPEAQAVVDVVEDELAFAMENQGLGQNTMRKRIEETLDQLNIAHLRRRPISSLSGGERQRVAIASVLTLQPQIIVLDEPTSQLDPQAAEEVLDTLIKLNHDLGLTVILSEHRLERVAGYADRFLYLLGRAKPPIIDDPATVMAQVPLTPPIVELGKHLGWSPLPLTIKEGRQFACKLDVSLPAGRQLQPPSHGVSQAGESQTNESSAGAKDLLLEVRHLSFSYNGYRSAQAGSTLRDVALVVKRGEFVAIMGRNGAGKSTLLKQCIGLLKPDRGQVRVLGFDTRSTPVEKLARYVGYVPQNPNALLFADTVAQELAFTRQAQNLEKTDDEPLLETLGLRAMKHRYPRDLSAGERQRVALASVLVGDPDLILLDEPTRGLDYRQKAALISFLKEQKRRQKGIVVVTHDVELVAQCAERVILMGEGEIIVDGPVREVMSDSQVFASQINKLFRDPRFLTVEDVVHALAETPKGGLGVDLESAP